MERNRQKVDNTFERGAKAVGHGLTAIIKRPANAIVYGANMIVSENKEDEQSKKEDQKITLGQGVYGLGKGLVMGVAGVVKDPIMGAQTGGLSGFVKGVGTGVVGVVARPVKGVADLMESVDQRIDGKNRSMKRSESVNQFSAPLARQIEDSGGLKIPIIMSDCLTQLQTRGMEEEGLFRVSGSYAIIQEARKNLAAGNKISYEKLAVADVASLFKLWLRDLPTPLIPFTHYSEVIDHWKVWNEQYSEKEKLKWKTTLRGIIKSIGQPELECLRRLILFLSTVAKHSEENLMTSKNLATCLAPNLLYEECKEVPLLANAHSKAGEMHAAIETVNELIDDVEFFFFEDVAKDNLEDSDEQSLSCELLSAFNEENHSVSAYKEEKVNTSAVVKRSRRKCQPPSGKKNQRKRPAKRRSAPPPPSQKKGTADLPVVRSTELTRGKCTDI